MHYAFDAWMAREYPAIEFERYCDDVVVHCRNEAQAHQVREAIADRLAECGGLQLHPDKTRIVYCKDGKQAWLARAHLVHVPGVRVPRAEGPDEDAADYFFGFNPAISDEAAKRIRGADPPWRLHLRSGSTLEQLAPGDQPGRAGLDQLLRRGSTRPRWSPPCNRIDHYLMRWLVRKYKRFQRQPATSAGGPEQGTPGDSPSLFAHWKLVHP